MSDTDTPWTDESISQHTAYAGYGRDRVEVQVEHVEVADCRNIERDLRAQLATVTAERDAALKDAERLLQFLAANDAFIHVQKAKHPYPETYQVWNQDEDEEFHIISGEGRFFKTVTDAVDAAMKEKNDVT